MLNDADTIERFERPRLLPAQVPASSPLAPEACEPHPDSARGHCAGFLADLAREITLPVLELAVLERTFLAGWAARSLDVRRQALAPLPRGVTPRQLDLLRAFAAYVERTGISPTAGELADVMGVTKVTVWEHVQELLKKKCLRREGDRGRARAVTLAVIVPPAAEAHR